jgi:serine/threonine protein kinase/Tfp pilus assembly protein PilF
MMLSPGAKLGPYEILERIGAGGMGEVWKARDTRLGRIVAIKKVKEQHSERFKQEARSIAALNHPYICQLFDIGPDYLVLEYVEGKPLSSPLPDKETVPLAIQIASALEEAHQHGIIHRDLKPSNIMVTDKGLVKLLDFGLAKPYEQDASASQVPTADFPATQAGAILGTVAYMSPEQAQGKPVDTRSDIFSFGLLLYEMLSGRRAFTGDSNFAVIMAIVKEEPPPLRTSPSLEKIVRRCLAKQPLGRYQTISEAKTALEQVFEEKAKTSAEPPPSIAVLPFVNMSGDKEQEYFSDGLAEEIINALTHIEGLRVIARTSAFAYKGIQEDIRKIAKALSATNILEGSVRKAGNRIRVTAQLIIAAEGIHLWSERYDRDLTDVFIVQDEIATAIANVLQLKLTTETAPQRRYKPNPAAHDAYLKARHLWGKYRPEPLAQAKKYLEEAISLDPNYSLAHCGLADHYLLVTANIRDVAAHEAMPLIREESRKALDNDPSMPEAHGMLGVVAAAYDYDWKEAERQFRLAMARDPVPPRVRQWYGFWYLGPMGRAKEAVKQIEQGLKEDPLDIILRGVMSWSLLNAGMLPEAQAEAHKVLEFEENQPSALLALAYAEARQGKWVEAIHSAEKASPMISLAAGILGGLLRHIGETGRAEEWMRRLPPGDYGAPLGLSHYHYLCGDIDSAADWMEKAIEQRDPLATIQASLLFRSTPRWPALAKLMNLSEEAR